MAENDEHFDRWMDCFPGADITPAEFEQFVAEVLRAAEPGLEDFRVQMHERVAGLDGTFDIDATVRFRHLGMDFLVLVEAKRHANRIKRELVQVLFSKVQSAGAHKGVLISTAAFQRGALEFAKSHGAALVRVTEGRFTFETRNAIEREPLSRKEAAKTYGIPTFVGQYFGPADPPASTTTALIEPEGAETIRELLLGISV